MYNDLGARTREAKEISKKSKSILSSIVKGDEISGKTCLTRTSAGFMALEELNGAIIVIVNPPSSAWTSRGIPVGFVNELVHIAIEEI